MSTAFLFGVLGFSVVGQTNFPLSSSWLVGSGHGASINTGVSGGYNAVKLPAYYSVSSSDVGRMLALRSNTYPTFNSGLFKVTAISSSINALIVDYRSPDQPPPETGTLQWSLFVSEATFSGVPSYYNGGPGTGIGNYQSSGSYPGQRIILQSPHSSSWQVRFCYESSFDRNNTQTSLSVAPGFGGNSSGDFPTGSFDRSQPVVAHLHTPQWMNNPVYNTTQGLIATVAESNPVNSSYISAPADITNATVRFYAFGDITTGSVMFFFRNVANASDSWYAFGVSQDDEPQPPLYAQKLWAIGNITTRASDITFATGLTNSNGGAMPSGRYGVAFGLNNTPVSCVIATYIDISNSQNYGGLPRNYSVAQDNLMLNATELQNVDLWAGTLNGSTGFNQAPTPFQFDPRRMGSMPIVLQGRANFNTWSLTADKSYFHTKNGMFLPWNGPNVYT
jgi:hypothetical protein